MCQCADIVRQHNRAPERAAIPLLPAAAATLMAAATLLSSHIDSACMNRSRPVSPDDIELCRRVASRRKDTAAWLRVLSGEPA